jgi:hypothetical protein
MLCATSVHVFRAVSQNIRANGALAPLAVRLTTATSRPIKPAIMLSRAETRVASESFDVRALCPRANSACNASRRFCRSRVALANRAPVMKNNTLAADGEPLRSAPSARTTGLRFRRR